MICPWTFRRRRSSTIRKSMRLCPSCACRRTRSRSKRPWTCSWLRKSPSCCWAAESSSRMPARNSWLWPRLSRFPWSPATWGRAASPGTIRSWPGTWAFSATPGPGIRSSWIPRWSLLWGRASTTATPGDLKVYKGNRKFIHVDIDPGQIGKNIMPDLGICADAKLTLQALLDESQAPQRQAPADEIGHCPDPDQAGAKNRLRQHPHQTPAGVQGDQRILRRGDRLRHLHRAEPDLVGPAPEDHPSPGTTWIAAGPGPSAGTCRPPSARRWRGRTRWSWTWSAISDFSSAWTPCPWP